MNRPTIRVAALWAVAQALGQPSVAQPMGISEMPASSATTKNPEVPRKTAPLGAARHRIIDGAVDRLMAEAEDLGKYKDAKINPTFGRPHHTIGKFGPQMAPEVLDRMLRSFTGSAYEDTYIRWHLMHVIKQARQEERRQMGPKLVKLVKRMPGPLMIRERPEWRDAPKEIAKAYWKIFSSLRVVIGYPPYEKRFDPPESFQYMEKNRRRIEDLRWKDALVLREKFKRIYDNEAIEFNRRVREVNWIVRQYRGELIYALLWTGDPAMARLIISTIDEHARKHSGIALDLLSFCYVAAFDGALNLYEPTLLKDLSQQLERSARANDRWFNHKLRLRNFADYAFHFVHLLRGGGGFTQERPILPKTTRQRLRRRI